MLNDLPANLLECIGELLLKFLLVGVLIVGTRQEETLEEVGGHLQLAHGSGDGLAGIDGETIVAVVLELAGNHLAHLGKIILLGGCHAIAQHSIEQFLVHLGILIDENLSDREAEVGSSRSGHLFVHAQYRGQKHLAAASGFVGVEDDAVAHLQAHELRLCLLVFDVILRRDGGALHDDTIGFLVACLVEFYEFASDVRLLVRHLTRHFLAIAMTITGVLLLHHLVGHFDIIIRYVQCAVDGHVELGLKSQIEGELKVLLRVEVHARVGAKHGLAQHGHLVLNDIVTHLAAQLAVHHVGKHLHAIHALQHAHGNMTGAETLDGTTLAQLVETALDIGFVIFFDKRHSEPGVHIVDFFKFYVHFSALVMILFLFNDNISPFLTKANAKLLPKCHSHQIFNHYYSDFHLVWGCGRVIPTKKVGRSLRATAPPCVKHSTCAPHHMVSTMLCSSAMRRMFKMA